MRNEWVKTGVSFDVVGRVLINIRHDKDIDREQLVSGLSDGTIIGSITKGSEVLAIENNEFKVIGEVEDVESNEWTEYSDFELENE